MKFLREELEQMAKASLRRSLRQRQDRPGRTIGLDGRELLNFSSNNYLGMAFHPQLIAAAREGARAGTGSTASRLVTGNVLAHEELEASIASFHGLPAARVFNSGYQANLGLISAIAGKEDLIVSDRLNHASLIDGSRLSGATIRIADHADLTSFATLLGDSHGFRRRFVVTDSVFSMDGDLAPVAELRELCDRSESFLIVDEAHAAGVLGPGGKGICAAAGVVPDALTGGFGKGFGSFGGYVTGSEDLCEFLLNRARSFVFSTSLPSGVLASSIAAVQLAQSESGGVLRTALSARISQLAEGLRTLNLLEDRAGQSPIFPIMAKMAPKAMDWTEVLLSNGIFCQAIRPPTVAPNTSRLRIAVSALHTESDIDVLLEALGRL